MIKPKCLLAILMLFAGNCLLAQSVPSWGGGADQKDLSFGFSFSYVSNYFKIDKSPNWRAPFFDTDGTQITSPLKTISSPNSQGFAVGFLARYRLTDHLETRVAPSFVFADRTLSYTFEDPSQNTLKTVQATTLDVPLSIKLKSDRIGDFRAYVLGGIKYSQGIGSKANIDANTAPIDKHVKNITGYASYEAGLGCDIYFEFFKLSPEIKLSNSLGNVLMHENHPYSAPIDKLSLHTLMFSLYFE